MSYKIHREKKPKARKGGASSGRSKNGRSKLPRNGDGGNDRGDSPLLVSISKSSTFWGNRRRFDELFLRGQRFQKLLTREEITLAPDATRSFTGAPRQSPETLTGIFFDSGILGKHGKRAPQGRGNGSGSDLQSAGDETTEAGGIKATQGGSGGTGPPISSPAVADLSPLDRGLGKVSPALKAPPPQGGNLDTNPLNEGAFALDKNGDLLPSEGTSIDGGNRKLHLSKCFPPESGEEKRSENVVPVPTIRVSVVAARMQKMLGILNTSPPSVVGSETWRQMHESALGFRSDMLWLLEHGHYQTPGQSADEKDLTPLLNLPSAARRNITQSCEPESERYMSYKIHRENNQKAGKGGASSGRPRNER